MRDIAVALPTLGPYGTKCTTSPSFYRHCVPTGRMRDIAVALPTLCPYGTKCATSPSLYRHWVPTVRNARHRRCSTNIGSLRDEMRDIAVALPTLCPYGTNARHRRALPTLGPYGTNAPHRRRSTDIVSLRDECDYEVFARYRHWVAQRLLRSAPGKKPLFQSHI